MTTTALTSRPRLLCKHLPTAAPRRSRGMFAALALLGWLAIGCLPDEASAAPSTNNASSPIAIISVLVDGRPLEVPARMQLLQAPSQPAPVKKVGTERLRVPSLAQRMEFRFGPNPTSNSPVRLRYRLEGFDAEWREAGGEMRLNVRFLDAADSTVSAQDFSVKGESA